MHHTIPFIITHSLKNTVYKFTQVYSTVTVPVRLNNSAQVTRNRQERFRGSNEDHRPQEENAGMVKKGELKVLDQIWFSQNGLFREAAILKALIALCL